MRKHVALSLLLLASACGSQDEPEKGVDTTLPSEPAKISGTLSAPGDYMPSDLQVCVETASGKTVSCNAKLDTSLYSGSYEIEVPAGAYRIYATTKEVPNFKAYYTQCFDPGCSSRAPAIVKVEEGETRSGIDPSWADRPIPEVPTYDDSGSVYTDMNAVDMNATDMNVTDPETSSDEAVDE
jgi:hypothetical protein